LSGFLFSVWNVRMFRSRTVTDIPFPILPYLHLFYKIFSPVSMQPSDYRYHTVALCSQLLSLYHAQRTSVTVQDQQTVLREADMCQQIIIRHIDGIFDMSRVILPAVPQINQQTVPSVCVLIQLVRRDHFQFSHPDASFPIYSIKYNMTVSANGTKLKKESRKSFSVPIEHPQPFINGCSMGIRKRFLSGFFFTLPGRLFILRHRNYGCPDFRGSSFWNS